MRKIKEVLRLKFEVGLSARQIAVSLQVGRATIGDYLNRFAASGLTWPFAASDAQLQQCLYSCRGRHCPHKNPGQVGQPHGKTTASANGRGCRYLRDLQARLDVAQHRRL